MTTFQQTMKMPSSGSFFNYLRSNNASLPVIGKGATIMHYTDRDVAEVIAVSEDGKTVKLERLEAVAARPNLPMGHQLWTFKPTGSFFEVVWRHSAWREKSERIVFTEAYKNAHGGEEFWADKMTPEIQKAVYGEEGYPCAVVEGVTEAKAVYTKIRILFGSKDYYYDWEF